MPATARPRRGNPKTGELEGRLLTLVTLALVAFGLVMVYSATSGSAAIASGDPSAYLKRQAIYALLGVGLGSFGWYAPRRNGRWNGCIGL